MKTFQVNHRVLGSIVFQAASFAKAIVIARALGSSIVIQF